MPASVPTARSFDDAVDFAVECIGPPFAAFAHPKRRGAVILGYALAASLIASADDRFLVVLSPAEDLGAVALYLHKQGFHEMGT